MRLRPAALALTLALAPGCGDAVDFVGGPPDPPAAPAGVSRVHDGLVYRAGFVLLREDALVVDVTVENPGGAARQVTYADDCVALMRAYWSPGTGVAWDQREGKSRCREERRTLDLGPGERRSFPTGASALTILDGRVRGRFVIAAYLRPVGADEVELVLGDVPLAFGGE